MKKRILLAWIFVMSQWLAAASGPQVGTVSVVANTGIEAQDPGITFTPPAGAVANPTTVTFSGAVAGSIYCSTQDDSTPVTNQIGTGCVVGTLGSTTSITSAVTVKAVSGLSGELDSAVASAAYTINSFTPAAVAWGYCNSGGTSCNTGGLATSAGTSFVVCAINDAQLTNTFSVTDADSDTITSQPTGSPWADSTYSLNALFFGFLTHTNASEVFTLHRTNSSTTVFGGGCEVYSGTPTVGWDVALATLNNTDNTSYAYTGTTGTTTAASELIVGVIGAAPTGVGDLPSAIAPFTLRTTTNASKIPYFLDYIVTSTGTYQAGLHANFSEKFAVDTAGFIASIK